jgi:hypothetical protein
VVGCPERKHFQTLIQTGKMEITLSRPNYYELLQHFRDEFRIAFKMYQSGDAVYIVSRKNSSFISIDLRDISGLIDQREEMIILSDLGRIVLFSSGDFMAQFYSKKQKSKL